MVDQITLEVGLIIRFFLKIRDSDKVIHLEIPFILKILIQTIALAPKADPTLPVKA